MNIRRAKKICEDFMNYYFNSIINKSELDYSCKPFMNLLQAVWEDVYTSDYSDLDITYFTIVRCISDLEQIPSDISSYYSYFS